MEGFLYTPHPLGISDFLKRLFLFPYTMFYQKVIPKLVISEF